MGSDVVNTLDVQDPSTLPGADWSQTLQNIVTHGATRLFDTFAAVKLYKSGAGQPVYADGLGNVYGQGLQANTGNNAPLGVPMALWLLIGAGVVYLAVKD